MNVQEWVRLLSQHSMADHFQTACYGPERRWKVAGRLGGGGGQGGKVQGWFVGEGMKSD